MEIIKTISGIRNKIKLLKIEGKKIGFVPTMGFLHEGHLSLVAEAKKHADIVVMSIFVNPIQFGPNEDFEKYPRDFERDEKLARRAGVDIMFYPDYKEMYKDDFQTYVTVEEVSREMCGAKRPGHFRGVATVVMKLFNITAPDIAVFGIKDAQQVRVIEKMVEDLNIDIQIIRGEIVRESDGLAMSSRNKYLSDTDRKEALCLKRSLLHAKTIIEAGERKSSKVKEAIVKFLEENNYKPRIDYIEIVDFKSIETTEEIKGEILIAEAFYIGATRLIDNILIKI